jgi:glycerol-3-phosphate acyltransferase PlsY
MIQTAYILGKMNGIDIRDYGSGNAGTTNAMRVLGPKAGLTVFFGDMFKSLVALLLVGALFGGSHPELVYVLKAWTFAGVVLGHDFPFYMNFKGGKGVATCAGLLLAVSVGSLKTFLLQFLLPAIIFFAIAVITKYISLASMTAFTSAVIIMWIFNGDLATKIVFALLCLFVIYRHRENIQRLLNHKENKVNFF